MFKITKFVIAAALTAIIAAPVMAQVECPCWKADDLSKIGYYGSEVYCELHGPEYLARIYGKDKDGNDEDAYVTVDFVIEDESACYYNSYTASEAETIDSLDVYKNCVQLISNECEGRPGILIDKSTVKYKF